MFAENAPAMHKWTPGSRDNEALHLSPGSLCYTIVFKKLDGLHACIADGIVGRSLPRSDVQG